MDYGFNKLGDMMSILRTIAELMMKKKGKPRTDDGISSKDNVTVILRDAKTGEIVKQFTKHNIWTSYGRGEIRDALVDGGFNNVSYMYQNGTSSSEQSTSSSKPSSYVAQWVATWPASPAITGITEFDLRLSSGGSAAATIIISSFDKPYGLELEVTWQTNVTTS